MQHPTLPQGFYDTFERRFWAKVRKTDSCWLWTAAINERGYGVIGKGGHRGGNVLAHCASWILHYGDIPRGKHVLHHCDNPPCVNPSHLWAGTQRDNMYDCIAKGRSPILAKNGEANVGAKLTREQVAKIRELHKSGHLQVELARGFNVSKGQVHRIVRGIGWAAFPIVGRIEQALTGATAADTGGKEAS